MFTKFLELHWLTLHSLVIWLGLLIYAVASHTLRQRRHPSAAIAWVISLVLLPYVALPLYLFFGRRKVVDYRRSFGSIAPSHQAVGTGLEADQLASAMGLPVSAGFEQLAIHQNGCESLQTLRQMIHSATQTLDICTFLLGRDVLGDEISQLLIQRSRQGVRIRLLIDGIGVYLGGYPNLKPLISAGVAVSLFVSPLRSALRARTNLRNHRKIIIVDGYWLWTGGRNLAAEYFEGDPKSLRQKTAWVDLTFDLQGGVAQQAQLQFNQDWDFATHGKISHGPATASIDQASTGKGARLVPSGPDQVYDTVYTLLVSGCFTAHSRILLVTPYFVPDQSLLMALALAARRGLSVDLVLPRKSNHHLADFVRHAALRELVASGARIWLTSGMMHAKAVLIDDDLALIGSANLDERSLFLNYELMVAFYEPQVVQRFAAWIEPVKRGSDIYQPYAPGLMRELVEGMVRWIAFQL